MVKKNEATNAGRNCPPQDPPEEAVLADAGYYLDKNLKALESAIHPERGIEQYIATNRLKYDAYGATRLEGSVAERRHTGLSDGRKLKTKAGNHCMRRITLWNQSSVRSNKRGFRSVRSGNRRYEGKRHLLLPFGTIAARLSEEHMDKIRVIMHKFLQNA